MINLSQNLLKDFLFDNQILIKIKDIYIAYSILSRKISKYYNSWFKDLHLDKKWTNNNC